MPCMARPRHSQRNHRLIAVFGFDHQGIMAVIQLVDALIGPVLQLASPQYDPPIHAFQQVNSILATPPRTVIADSGNPASTSVRVIASHASPESANPMVAVATPLVQAFPDGELHREGKFYLTLNDSS